MDRHTNELFAYQLKQLAASGAAQAEMEARLKELVALERTDAISRFGMEMGQPFVGDSYVSNVIELPIPRE